mmetsp:Transcript_34619/g.87452  ORF Transcript_34619/g.87452 Transcript_34619/m.87452 type:complete len:218 (+) Transcript_34619:148-801(+)
MPLHLLLLLQQVLWHRVVHVSEHLVGAVLLLPLSSNQSIQHLLPGILSDLLLGPFLQPPLSIKEHLHPRDGVVCVCPHRHLLAASVPRSVVRRRVVPSAVSHGLHQYRNLVGDCYPPRLLHHVVDGPDVVAVAAGSLDVVAHAPHRDAVALVLLADGGADGVAVVAAEEDDGALEGGGEVEGAVEVALARGSVPEVAHHARILALHLERVGGACGLR